MCPSTIDVPVDITIGAAGAVTGVRGFGLIDVTPVAHPATGRYTITLDSRWGGAVVGVYCAMKQATGVARLVPCHISGDAFTTEVITIEVTPGTTTTLTDPASGDHIYVTIVLDELGLVVAVS
jgi:hypothetical protein